MPVGITARGGADFMRHVQGLTQDQALKALNDIKAHLSKPGKADGVLSLAYRSNAGKELELRRKSGFRLWGRGLGNQRLNDTREALSTLLKRAGLDSAEARLTAYLDKKGSHANRVQACELLALLGPPSNEALAEPESEATQSPSYQLYDQAQEPPQPDLIKRPADDFQPFGTAVDDSLMAPEDGDWRLDVHERPLVLNQSPAEPVHPGGLFEQLAQGQDHDIEPDFMAQALQNAHELQAEPLLEEPTQPPSPSPVVLQASSLNELAAVAQIELGRVLGSGGFGVAREIKIAGQAGGFVLKTFKAGSGAGATLPLSSVRTKVTNEAIVTFLNSNKEPGYAAEVSVVQPNYFWVKTAHHQYQMLAPGQLRQLIKSAGAGDVACAGLIMPKAEGQELNSLLKSKSLAAAERQLVIKNLLGSVKSLNRRGFVHRDLKPENLFFDPMTKKISLIDTGMLHKTSKKSPASRFVNGMAGTNAYLPEKALKREKYGTESDLHATAVIAMQMEMSPEVFTSFKQAFKDVVEKSPQASGADASTISAGYAVRLKNQASFEMDNALKRANVFHRLFSSGNLKFSKEAYQKKMNEYEKKYEHMKQLVAVIDKPSPMVSWALDAMDAANQPADRWADRNWAQGQYQQWLDDPRLSAVA